MTPFKGNEPIRQDPRKYTPKILQTVWAEVDRMLDEGLSNHLIVPAEAALCWFQKHAICFDFGSIIAKLIRGQRLWRIHFVTWMIYWIN